MVTALFKYLRMRYSKSYHKRVVTEYWSKAPATHGTVSEEQFTFYASKVDQLMRRYLGEGKKKILDHGAGEGSIALKLSAIQNEHGGGYDVYTSEMFEKYRDIIKEKGLDAYDASDLPESEFDGIFMNCAFYYIHPQKWRSEIERLLRAVKDGGYLFLTDVPTVKKIPVLYKDLKGLKKFLVCTFEKLTAVYQFDLGGFFVDETKIKNWFPQTIVEDEWCDYRSFFIIKKN